MKATKIIYWITTIAIFLFEGVMPAFFSRSEDAIKAFTTLGYPLYFNTLLTIFKVLGGLILVIPGVPPRLKEWAYAGFTFDFISASFSWYMIQGLGAFAVFPIIVLAVLMVSYVCWRKLQQQPLAAVK